MSSSKTSLTYKDSGVDINAGNELIEAIKDDVKKSHNDLWKRISKCIEALI